MSAGPSERATLVGDELHVSPRQMEIMQLAMLNAKASGMTDYEVSLAGMRSVGLTDKEIATRLMRETKVVVNYVG